MKKSNSFSALDIMIICVILTIYFLLSCSVNYLPITSILNENSDVLFIGDVANSLNKGHHLFEWRLTQAPYLFPDIFFARLFLSIFHLKISSIGLFYSYFFGASLFGLIYWNCYLSKIQNKVIPLSLFALLYSLFYCFGLTKDVLPLYFGLIGHHTGIAIPILVAIAATQLYFFHDEHYKNRSLFFLFAAIFIGGISDNLVISCFSPVLAIFIFLCFVKKEISFRKGIIFFSILLIAILLSKTWSYINPYPQDIEYMNFVLAGFPNNTLPSIHAFLSDFNQNFFKTPIFTILFSLYFFFFIVAVLHCFNIVREKNHARTATTFYSLFIISGPFFVIGLQLSLGIYCSIDHSRQWAIIILLSIIFGSIVFAEFFSEKIKLMKIILFLLSCFYLLLLSLELKKYNVAESFGTNIFRPLINCMKENHLPAGNYYISDYWLARPIRIYSNNSFVVSAYNNVIPFTNASNVSTARKANPIYVITGYSLDYNAYISMFGEPQHKYCQMAINGNNVNILDYSNNQKAITYLKEKAIHSY